MKNYRVILISFLLVFGFMACSEKETTSELGLSFDLGFEEQKVISDHGISVHFAQVVEDSRCPTDVICVWEGQVTVKLAVSVAENKKDISLISREGDYLDLARDTFENYIFILEAVHPYPQTTAEVAHQDYTVEMRVEEL